MTDFFESSLVLDLLNKPSPIPWEADVLLFPFYWGVNWSPLRWKNIYHDCEKTDLELEPPSLSMTAQLCLFGNLQVTLSGLKQPLRGWWEAEVPQDPLCHWAMCYEIQKFRQNRSDDLAFCCLWQQFPSSLEDGPLFRSKPGVDLIGSLWEEEVGSSTKERPQSCVPYTESWVLGTPSLLVLCICAGSSPFVNDHCSVCHMCVGTCAYLHEEPEIEVRHCLQLLSTLIFEMESLTKSECTDLVRMVTR